MNMTGYYESEEHVFMAEEAHRSNGHLEVAEKIALIKALNAIEEEEDWDDFFLDSYPFSYADRIWINE